MPEILRAYCDACDYGVVCTQSATFIVLDNRKEKVLPHPCEDLEAEELTGKSLTELAKENRLRYRYGLICRTCGEYDLYTNPSAKKAGHIRSIVGCISPADADKMECVHCGSTGLQSVMGEQIGCLAYLLGQRPKPNTFDCPKCKKGMVVIEMVGIS
jgi:hypothetical protein